MWLCSSAAWKGAGDDHQCLANAGKTSHPSSHLSIESFLIREREMKTVGILKCRPCKQLNISFFMLYVRFHSFTVKPEQVEYKLWGTWMVVINVTHVRTQTQTKPLQYTAALDNLCYVIKFHTVIIPVEHDAWAVMQLKVASLCSICFISSVGRRM